MHDTCYLVGVTHLNVVHRRPHHGSARVLKHLAGDGELQPCCPAGTHHVRTAAAAAAAATAATAAVLLERGGEEGGAGEEEDISQDPLFP